MGGRCGWRGYVYVGGYVSIIWDLITIQMALMKIHKMRITISCICFFKFTSFGAMETIYLLELYIFCNYKINEILDP